MVKWSSGTVRFGLTPQTSLMQIHYVQEENGLDPWHGSAESGSGVGWAGHICQSNAEYTVHNVRIEG